MTLIVYRIPNRYYVDTIGKNKGRIAEYIKRQLDEDNLGEQLRIPNVEKKIK